MKNLIIWLLLVANLVSGQSRQLNVVSVIEDDTMFVHVWLAFNDAKLAAIDDSLMGGPPNVLERVDRVYLSPEVRHFRKDDLEAIYLGKSWLVAQEKSSYYFLGRDDTLSWTSWKLAPIVGNSAKQIVPVSGFSVKSENFLWFAILWLLFWLALSSMFYLVWNGASHTTNHLWCDRLTRKLFPLAVILFALMLLAIYHHFDWIILTVMLLSCVLAYFIDRRVQKHMSSTAWNDKRFKRLEIYKS